MELNQQTRNQMITVILIDCLKQLNSMNLTRDEYDFNLKALLRERLSSEDEIQLALRYL